MTGALSEPELSELRGSVLSAALRDPPPADRVDGVASQRVWALYAQGEGFLRLAEHPVALGLVASILGPGPLLSNLSANITHPGTGAMTPHFDQDWAERPWPHALAAHAIWMLDDFTEENGATLVAPGSHLATEPPPDAHLVPATGPAGTALLLDARVWHGTGRNTSADDSRIGILAYYCRSYVRPQHNFALMLFEHLGTMSPSRRELLGL
ncbi:hypothetical protein DEH69_21355 [Streptomyces sp. PT12]|nr:hypothetical protein DEH69_21355 [Streptomyces sp. PT12]